jgi:hypothetical protein
MMEDTHKLAGTQPTGGQHTLFAPSVQWEQAGLLK